MPPAASSPDRPRPSSTASPALPPQVTAALSAIDAGPPRSLARHSEAGAAPAASVQASASVVASFQSEFHCLNFNSDGTLNSSFPFTTFFGIYVGDPNSFTIYIWSASIEAPRIGLIVYSGVGLTLGTSSIEFASAINFTTGMQQSQTLFRSRVPSCLP